jgi:hypothetical protein
MALDPRAIPPFRPKPDPLENFPDELPDKIDRPCCELVNISSSEPSMMAYQVSRSITLDMFGKLLDLGKEMEPMKWG